MFDADMSVDPIEKKIASAERQLWVAPFHLTTEHITAELAPMSGHDVLIFPMKQMGHEETRAGAACSAHLNGPRS